ncbi:MFS transporter [Pacificimonas flava]|uniref:Twin-arginine translocation pathway signal n=1 Tax=Pacificimonas flava TaxID=1234595 RepID=M2U3K1_9SPHN|nr:MFS transporter [Pacificimonas flava]EMD82607.1 twin-arginine translocation pathway signal [Pacificimonas flava]MBB5281434.1 MFS family permease [Pacificimonas flava]
MQSGSLRRALAPVAALLMSVALLLMGNGLQGALLPLRAAIEGQSSLAIGLLASSYFGGFVLGCMQAAKLVQRVGHIRAFTAAVALASTIALFHAMIVEPLVWWILRGITGFAFAVIFAIIESWLNEKSSSENRGTVFSVYTIVNLTVITVGQLFLTLGDPAAFPLFCAASILVSLSALPVALTRAEAPTPIEQTRVRLLHLFRQSPAGVAGALAVGLANGAFWALAPVFASDHSGGLSAAEATAYFMSAVVMGGAAGQWPLGLWSDKTDRRRVILFASVGATAAGVALTLFSDAFAGAPFLFAFVFGVFAFPINALSVAHLNDHVEDDGYVEAASGMLLTYGLGAVAGPFIASVIVGAAGIGALFLYTAAVHGAFILFIWLRIFRRSAPPEAAQVDFTDSLIVSVTVSNVETGNLETS